MNKLSFGMVALLAGAACGGSVVSQGAGGSGTGSGAGTSGTTGAGGSVDTGGCPTSRPNAGSSCAGVTDQLQCTYGDTVRPDCRVEIFCDGGSWQEAGTTCLQAADCGTVEPAAHAVCETMGDTCTYGDTICYCGCGGGLCAVPTQWQCSGPPTTPGCPAIVPNDGSPCSSDGTQCTYGTPCTPSGVAVACTGGNWVWDTMVVCAG